MLKYILPLVVALLLGVFLFIGMYRDPRYVPSPLIGKPAPEFSLPSLQDATYPVSSRELIGQPWVLNVWGTWCGGCREEHDTLLAIARQKAVPIVGLNWKDRNREAQQLLVRTGNPYVAVPDDPSGRACRRGGPGGGPGGASRRRACPVGGAAVVRRGLPAQSSAALSAGGSPAARERTGAAGGRGQRSRPARARRDRRVQRFAAARPGGAGNRQALALRACATG
jgi:cytochrome c biogenesis protein CcmG/thiol:disulfide interchange protein DsbE